MKLPSLLLGSFLAVMSVGEAFAQRSPGRGSSGGSSSRGGSSSSGSSSRGPSYNPSRGSSSPSSPSRSTPSRPSSGSSVGGSRSGSTPRGPSYNPGRGTTTTPTRPSTGSSVGGSNSGSTPRGPSYNPGRGTTTTPTRPSTPSTPRGPSYNPGRGTTTTPTRPSSPSTPRTTTPRGPNYNPGRGAPSTPGRVVVRGPRYNPAPSTARPYRPVVIRNYRPHVPYYRTYVHSRRYIRPYDYYFGVRRYHIYRYWLFEPVSYGYSNGYYVLNDYPYYVYHGYRHRYSTVDTCSYQLVDSTSNTAVKSFTERVCQAAYDECALERDVANQSLSEIRYFCAERVDEEFANTSDDSVVFDPQPNEQTDSVWSAINNYLSDRSYKEIWRDGYRKERFDPKCSVEKVRKHKLGCKYVIKVAGKNYPDHEGEICSHKDSAALAGCDVGTQKKNAGCLLKLAVSEGLCH